MPYKALWTHWTLSPGPGGQEFAPAGASPHCQAYFNSAFLPSFLPAPGPEPDPAPPLAHPQG